MAKTNLTAQRVRELFHYDPDTGVFTRLKIKGSNVRFGPILKGGRSGKGYQTIRIDKVRYYAHRLAWLYTSGEWPSGDIDHINGNRLDNRIVNLRDASRSKNLHNLWVPNADNKSGFRGVVGVAGTRRFMANITVGGVTKYLGTHASPELAASAYIAAKLALVGLAESHK